MRGIVVFWNMMARIFFRNNLKREAAVSPKFWLIFFTSATTSHSKRETLKLLFNVCKQERQRVSTSHGSEKNNNSRSFNT
jgi:hypothetical protein